MEVRGTTHLRNALFSLYHRVGSTPSKIFLRAHIYGNNMVTVRIDNRWIIPIAYDFPQLNNYVESDSPPDSPTIDKCIVPLIPAYNHTHWNCTVKRTADPLIEFLLCGRMDTSATLRTAKTTSGEVYYGGCGSVLDKNFNPLIVFAMEMTYPMGRATKLNPVCVINPIVFQRDDILSKYIVKKMIPFLSDCKIQRGWNDDRWYKDTKMKVIITHEISKFIEKPAKPVGFLDSRLWECAESNINEMLEV